MARTLVVLLVAFVAAGALAEPLGTRARAEIDALMVRLETSACQFQRNGDWHAGADVKSHLMRKLAYLVDRGLVGSAEQFIERAASSSSTSGKPYLVRCGGGSPVTSATWFTEQLKVVRGTGAGRT